MTTEKKPSQELAEVRADVAEARKKHADLERTVRDFKARISAHADAVDKARKSYVQASAAHLGSPSGPVTADNVAAFKSAWESLKADTETQKEVLASLESRLVNLSDVLESAKRVSAQTLRHFQSVRGHELRRLVVEKIHHAVRAHRVYSSFAGSASLPFDQAMENVPSPRISSAFNNAVMDATDDSEIAALLESALTAAPEAEDLDDDVA